MLSVAMIAPFAAIGSFVAGFIWLGGWGWLLFVWFGFMGTRVRTPIDYWDASRWVGFKGDIRDAFFIFTFEQNASINC